MAGKRSHATSLSVSVAASRASVVSTLATLLEQSAAHRHRHSSGTVRHTELLVQVLDVRLDRRHAQEELLGDLGKAVPVRDETQDLLLAVGEHRCVVLLAQADL